MSRIEMASSLKGQESALISQIFNLPEKDRRLLLVTDQNTYAALGERVNAALMAADYRLSLVRFDRDVSATSRYVTELSTYAEDNLAILGVGSGTINDLCKYVASTQQKPYAIFPTAPSMNGYISPNASIIHANVPRSLPAQPPVGVFCDLEVIASAPKRLIRSGLADLLCRTTAQADWLLSHYLLGTPYNEDCFTALEPYEKQLRQNARRLAEGEKNLVEILMKALLTSGESMQKAGGSYPASQGEHMIAHAMHILYNKELKPTLHGEQIGVTTITMARLQERVMISCPTIRASHVDEERVVHVYGRDQADILIPLYLKKALSEKQAKDMNEMLKKEWPKIKKHIQAVQVKTERLSNALVQAHAPHKPDMLDWDRNRYENAVTHAHLTRDRFTFLDLAAMGNGRYWFE